MCTLELHLDEVVFQLDVVNAFNSMLKRVIFQKLRAIGGDVIQFIIFVGAFNAFESPLFYSCCNHEIEVMVILFAMGIR